VAARDVCPHVSIEGSFDDYWAERGSELRRILRRSDRALERRGASFRGEIVSDPARVVELLPALTALHDAAEAERPRQHLLAPPWRDFTLALLDATARAGMLRLFVGWIGDDLAVFALTFDTGDTLSMWLNRFHPEYGDVSPGHLVFRDMVRFGFEHGHSRVDFLLGDFRYKWLWCSASTPTHTVTGARGLATRALGTTGRQLLGRRRARRAPSPV
jgi:CelD/BcsL family acetyltransferase involved in cellulose biosynthesis